jgi:hypothetical protein
MDRLETPQTRCRAGFARADITPPVGIYHRLWGAASHERSTGVHRPLTATALWLDRPGGGDARIIISLDQCLLDAVDIEAICHRIRASVPDGLAAAHVHCSHTHASGWMSRSREPYPGGELIAPYLKRVAQVCGDLALKVVNAAQPATIVYGSARCSLAANRDCFDRERQQFVCGFNPAGPADDAVLVAAVISEEGSTLGTVVNYACHPTTLAWQNTLLSPDFVGAMREVMEQHTGAPCLFLQGASGDLGPRDGFVGDPAVADRNGRQLGFAALSGLEALPRPATMFRYAGPVVSGATLGTWAHEPIDSDTAARLETWSWRTLTVDLPYRPDLPTIEETQAARGKWEADEIAARAANHLNRTRDCRAHVERMTRQLNRLTALPTGPTYPYVVTVGRLGTALWVFAPGELYQAFQTTLRARFPGTAVVVATLTNDWQPGYLPTAASYGHGIYQEMIAVIAPGALETLTDVVTRDLAAL